MRKILIISMMIACFNIVAYAQNWQQSSHGGYTCYSFTTAENIIVYAAKGIAGHMGEVLFIKIKAPFNWGNTSTGNVMCFKKNLTNGEADSQPSFF